MRRIMALAIGLTLLYVVAGDGADASVSLGTFNLQLFPRPATERARVVDAVVELDAEIFAVQEVQDPHAWFAVLWLASQRTGRDYRMLMSNCGGSGMTITTGLVFDAQTWRPILQREYPQLRPDRDGRCDRGQPGLLGVFERDDGQRLGVLSVHFKPFVAGFEVRKRQWRSVVKILDRVEAELDVPVVAMGDYNSTGFTGEPPQEREFVEDIVADAGFALPTADVECTEYWRAEKEAKVYEPSVLDHAVATRGDWTARPLGMCARLSCRPTPIEQMDPDYRAVSDHCPVRVAGEL